MAHHLNAEKEDIAKLVLLPGDPLRARYFANKYLTKCKLVNTVRGMDYFTGYYKKTRITIGGSGMGCPSLAIYAHELYKFYDVDTIIRLGTCGSYIKNNKIHKIINVSKASGENRFASALLGNDVKQVSASPIVYNTISDVAQTSNISILSGPAHSADIFYRERLDDWQTISKNTGAICVEMECFALFCVAAQFKKQAGGLLTIADNFYDNTESENQIKNSEKEKGLDEMFRIGLETCVKLDINNNK